MSLSLYHKKRNFSDTPEPEGKEKSSKATLRFVVQKHDASSLHYDFRLEMEGVLKSWAVPKGPSLNPKDKRLAMMVEDHPYDYRTFEGTIPEGNYGAGTVIVWDEGTYEPTNLQDATSNGQEEVLLKQLENGNLKFVLHGKKLQGEFSLVQMKNRGNKSWILIKKRDEHASEEDITTEDKSAISGRTLAQVAKANHTTLHHPENNTEHPPAKQIKKPASATQSVKKAASTSKKNASSTAKNKNVKNSKKAEDTTAALQLSLEDGVDQTINISNQELKVTNLDKLYWKKEACSKMDVINYYLKIAPYILSYLQDRPQSLNRYPNGISGAHFFQKDIRGKVPDWIETFEFFSESTNEKIQYLVCKDEASLIYMANLGCIEIHPWHSSISAINNPSYCLIDLDPDNNPYDEVIETAHVVKKILDAAKAPCYCKTSGSTGMHIYVPLGENYTYDQSKQLAEIVVTLVNKELPSLTSLERNPEKRKGKVYLDFLQNHQTQTVAAPYSLRPKPGVPVSTPLHWDEVKRGLTAATYTINNIFDRLKSEGDLFSPVLGKGVDLNKVLKNIETHFTTIELNKK